MQMRMKKKRGVHHALIVSLTVFLTLILVAVTLVDQLGQRVDAEQAKQLREVLRRAAISCYAVEGRYPESLEYLVENYGVVVDQSKFIVDYGVVSQNIMPIIEVIWVEGAVG